MKKNWFWRFLYKLHRYTGLFSALILIMLAVTGIALNHTEDLELDSQMVQSPTLLDWYNIKPSHKLKSFSTKDHWLTKVDQQLYFDHTLLSKNIKDLLGTVATNDFIVVALKDSLLLLSLQGELIEQTTFESIQNIGLGFQQNIVIKSNNSHFISQDGLISWDSYPKNNLVTWSNASAAPQTLSQNINHQFRSSILPIERVILDIHSGRFFGYFGVIIVDISGVFLIILALSGCVVWLKHKLRGLKRHK